MAMVLVMFVLGMLMVTQSLTIRFLIYSCLTHYREKLHILDCQNAKLCSFLV